MAAANNEKEKKQRVLSGRQKVAIFLVSLGMEASSEILNLPIKMLYLENSKR